MSFLNKRFLAFFVLQQRPCKHFQGPPLVATIQTGCQFKYQIENVLNHKYTVNDSCVLKD